MRYIKDLSQESQKILKRIYKESKYHQVRQRSQCILLSYQGYSTTQLKHIFNVKLLTIYNWFNAWESRKLSGLYDRGGRGRKQKLNWIQKEKIKEWIKISPKNIDKIRSLVKEKYGIDVSKKTVKRILRAFNFSWHRIRKKVKGKADITQYYQKEQELQKLKLQHEEGQIDLRFFDESGFCLEPYVPYAWQEKDRPIEVETSNRLNVLGFMNRDNDLDAYIIVGSVNTETVIACIDDFCKNLEKTTVLVVDNASTHTSKAFKEKIPKWKTKDLEIFYLPTYSPELNLIEILWRFIKYEWIEFDAYKSWNHLVDYVDNVIKGFGDKYIINFG